MSSNVPPSSPKPKRAGRYRAGVLGKTCATISAVGNQHEVRQLEPFLVQWGAAIPIKAGFFDNLQGKMAELQRHYMFVERSDGAFQIVNLDYDSAHIERTGEFLCIQSGGKMWCGYRAFIDLLTSLAPQLENATLYIADEQDFVDRIVINAGSLKCERVHFGFGYPLDDWPATRTPRQA